MNAETPAPEALKPLSRQDFVSDQMVRWCPGCGDFAILAQVQKTMPALGVPRERIVFISGIGCSSRFPYYMNTYGFHSIHGRAPTVATGLKTARPELEVWVVTGDGDALSIGGNHFLHALRRNIGIRILLFNNRIYGLTKGQYSPTSERGKLTKSSPLGTVERPISPVRVALAAEATFVARSVDADVEHLSATLERAAKHQGTAFVEIYQNCVVFNDNAFAAVESRATRDESALKLEQGKPLVFGAKRDKGIRLKGLSPEVVSFDPARPPKDLLIHNENAGPQYAWILAQLEPPDFPVPLGVFRQVLEPSYEAGVHAQIAQASQAKTADLAKLLAGPETWEVR